ANSYHNNGAFRFRKPTLGFLWTLGLATFAYYVHSGAFISNDFFPNHFRISSHMTRVEYLLGHWNMSVRIYRSAGMMLLPILTYIVDGSLSAAGDFRDALLTSRYLIFVFAIWGQLYLASVLIQLYGRAISVTFAVL